MTEKLAPKGMVKVVNNGFGNRCVICGNHFDSEGVCSNGHFKNSEYLVSEDVIRKNQSQERTDKKKKVVKSEVCQTFGNRCTICGSYFDEGDNVCANGHMLGVKYLLK